MRRRTGPLPARAELDGRQPAAVCSRRSRQSPSRRRHSRCRSRADCEGRARRARRVAARRRCTNAGAPAVLRTRSPSRPEMRAPRIAATAPARTGPGAEAVLEPVARHGRERRGAGERRRDDGGGRCGRRGAERERRRGRRRNAHGEQRCGAPVPGRVARAESDRVIAWREARDDRHEVFGGRVEAAVGRDHRLPGADSGIGVGPELAGGDRRGVVNGVDAQPGIGERGAREPRRD